MKINGEVTDEGRAQTAFIRAGGLAGVVGLVTFLVAHHLWIVPIWFVAPVGALVAAAGGAAAGAAYRELLPHLPRRPWTSLAVMAGMGMVLLPAVFIAEASGPIFAMNGEGGGTFLVPGPQVLLDVVLGLLATATLVGAALGWAIGRSLRSASAMALAAFLFALGPGHNVPLLGGTPAVGKELAILAISMAAASVVLVEAQARAANRQEARRWAESQATGDRRRSR